MALNTAKDLNKYLQFTGYSRESLADKLAEHRIVVSEKVAKLVMNPKARLNLI